MKFTKQIEHLKREVDGCEALIKQYEEKEESMKEKIEGQNTEIYFLKSNQQENQTLEALECSFEKKLEDLKECLLLSMKTQTNSSKSFADIINSQPE